MAIISEVKQYRTEICEIKHVDLARIEFFPVAQALPYRSRYDLYQHSHLQHVELACQHTGYVRTYIVFLLQLCIIAVQPCITCPSSVLSIGVPVYAEYLYSSDYDKAGLDYTYAFIRSVISYKYNIIVTGSTSCTAGYLLSISSQLYIHLFTKVFRSQ